MAASRRKTGHRCRTTASPCSPSATARVCHVAFYETGIENLAGTRSLFLNAPRQWLLDPDLLPPNPDQLVVEVLETVAVDEQVLAGLARIRAKGFRIALDDFVLTAGTEPLLDLADIVKVDLRKPWDEAAVVRFRQLGVTLLAEKVEDVETFERLRDSGFTLFQGYFYARAKTRNDYGGRRGNNRAALLQLLVELQKDDVDVKTVERIVAQDAQLTFLLLRYVNSAVFHYAGKISTVFQALQVLGFSRIRNMAVIMLLANNGAASRLLLARALTRAGMCERLAPAARLDPDPAFLAGLLSMMGSLLGQSLSRLMGELSLSPGIKAAVLERKGALGSLLGAVDAFENARVDGWPPERVETFNATWLESQVWTTRMLSAVTGS